MRKAGLNASWNRLEPGQRLELARWLFEEKVGYQKALDRARKKFGYAGSVSGLRRFYQRTWEERLLTGSATTETMIDAVEQTGASADRMRSAGLKMVARMFLQKVLETPEDLKEWGPLAKLLLQSEDNELRRQLKSEENDLRRQQLEFTRSRFQFDMARAARKALPQLQEMEDARKQAQDPEAWELEENRRLNQIVLRMFGDCTPELRPETPEEKANPELVEQRVAALHAHARARYAAEAREREEERRRAAAAEAAAQVQSQSSEAAEERDPEPVEQAENAERVEQTQTEKAVETAADEPPEAPWEDAPPRETPEERQRRSDELMQRAYELRRMGG